MAHVQLEITHLHHVAGEQYLAFDPYPVDQGAVGAVMVLHRQNAKAFAQKEGAMVAADAGMVHHDGAAWLTAKSGKAVLQEQRAQRKPVVLLDQQFGGHGKIVQGFLYRIDINFTNC